MKPRRAHRRGSRFPLPDLRGQMGEKRPLLELRQFLDGGFDFGKRANDATKLFRTSRTAKAILRLCV